MRYYYIFCKCWKYRQLPYFMICFFLQLGMILTLDSAGEFAHSSGCKDENQIHYICKHSPYHSFHHHHDKSVWFQSHFSLETAGSSFQRIFWYFEKGLYLIWIDRQFLSHCWNCNCFPWERKKNNLWNWFFNTIYLILTVCKE